MKLIRILLELGARDDYVKIRSDFNAKRASETQVELKAIDDLIVHFEEICSMGLNCSLYTTTIANLKKDRARLAAEQDNQ